MLIRDDGSLIATDEEKAKMFALSMKLQFTANAAPPSGWRGLVPGGSGSWDPGLTRADYYRNDYGLWRTNNPWYILILQGTTVDRQNGDEPPNLCNRSEDGSRLLLAFYCIPRLRVDP